MKQKVISSTEAVAMVKTGDALAIQGFIGFAHAEELSVMLERRFQETGQPRDLTLIHAAGQGDGKEVSMNHYGHEGMVKRLIGGHFNWAPKLNKLVSENKIEVYNFPQGVMLDMYRAMGANQPGVITRVGMRTFVDPRVEGGKFNQKTTEDIVKVIEINGKEYLHYQPYKIDVAFIRGTTADEAGNITMEKEGVICEGFYIAQATKRYGGKVIAQVERIAANGTLSPKQIKVPGVLVDAIVVAKPEYHMITNNLYYDSSVSGETRCPMGSLPTMGLSERKVIARRGAMELFPDATINLGVGIPDGVASVANEEGILGDVTLTIESGVMGGVSLAGNQFGGCYNPMAIIEHNKMFNMYDGGVLDVTYLGLAQLDDKGDVNVSKFGSRISGVGGFVNISQGAKKVVFCGTLTNGGLKVAIENGQLRILNEGRNKKFIKKVEQISFSGAFALEEGQSVLFVTERAVFELTPEGIVLTEIAPGVSLEQDVLAQIEFPVKVSPQLKLMDSRIFKEELMEIKSDFQAKSK